VEWESEFPEYGFWPRVGVGISLKKETPNSGYVLLLDRILNLVLCGFGQCTVLVHYCSPFIRRLENFSQVILKYTINMSHNMSRNGFLRVK